MHDIIASSGLQEAESVCLSSYNEVNYKHRKSFTAAENV